MKLKYFLIFFVFLLAISIIVVDARKPVGGDPCPIKSDTNVVFYGETGWGGVGTPSRSWMIHFLDWWQQQDSSINYVELDANDIKSDCDLSSFPNLKLYIQPGGDAYKQQNKLGLEGKSNIQNYISNGGGFFGSCAGFYYAAEDYFWQGEYYNWPDMLDYFPVTVEGSITDIADYDSSEDHKVTTLSTGFNTIYYGGPTIGWRDTTGPVPGEVEASYTEIPGELPAIIKYNKALLTSVHLEAFENDGISGLSTEDRIENYKYLGNLINEVAETNFNVPAYTNPPVCGNNVKEVGEFCDDGDLNGESCLTQGFDAGTLACFGDCSGYDVGGCVHLPNQCEDGIDNDGDSFIDYPNDLGCDSVIDDDEIDYTKPVELLFDGFEDGNTNGWSTYGAGTPWIASTDTAYQGSWSVRAKQTGVSDDSFIEAQIIGDCSYQLNFEYYRKLVGLDGVDDFEVQYQNGGWISVEHLGSSSANDGTFQYRSFVIPNSATAIRFKCEVGAVSEKCYVDNIRLTCE